MNLKKKTSYLYAAKTITLPNLEEFILFFLAEKRKSGQKFFKQIFTKNFKL